MTITLAIRETVTYGAEFTLDELNALCAKHDIPAYGEEEEDLAVWLQDYAREAIEREDGMLEDIEHSSGDIQGQEWAWSRA